MLILITTSQNDLGHIRFDNLLISDYRENFHEVDEQALKNNRKSNQKGTKEHQQAQKDREKLVKWGGKLSFLHQLYRLQTESIRFLTNYER